MSKGLLQKRGLNYQGLSDSGHSGSLSASDISASGGDLHSRSWSSGSDINWHAQSRYSNVLAIPESEQYCLERQACSDESLKGSRREENKQEVGTVAFYSENDEMAGQGADDDDSEALETHRYISASCPSLNRLPMDNMEQQLPVIDEALVTNRITQGNRLSVADSYRAGSNKDTHESRWGTASQAKLLLVKDSENSWDRMKSGSESTLCKNQHFGDESISQRTLTMSSRSPSLIRMLQRGSSLSMSKLYLQNSHESGLDRLHQDISHKHHHRSVDDVLFDHGHFRVVHFKAPEPNSRIAQWPTNLITKEQRQEKKHALVQSDEQGFKMTDTHFSEENKITAENDRIIQQLESDRMQNNNRNESTDPTTLADDWSRNGQDECINEFTGECKLHKDERVIKKTENAGGIPNLKEVDNNKETAVSEGTDRQSGSTDQVEISKTHSLKRKADCNNVEHGKDINGDQYRHKDASFQNVLKSEDDKIERETKPYPEKGRVIEGDACHKSKFETITRKLKPCIDPERKEVKNDEEENICLLHGGIEPAEGEIMDDDHTLLETEMGRDDKNSRNTEQKTSHPLYREGKRQDNDNTVQQQQESRYSFEGGITGRRTDLRYETHNEERKVQRSAEISQPKSRMNTETISIIPKQDVSVAYRDTIEGDDIESETSRHRPIDGRESAIQVVNNNSVTAETEQSKTAEVPSIESCEGALRLQKNVDQDDIQCTIKGNDDLQLEKKVNDNDFKLAKSTNENDLQPEEELAKDDLEHEIQVLEENLQLGKNINEPILQNETSLPAGKQSNDEFLQQHKKGRKISENNPEPENQMIANDIHHGKNGYAGNLQIVQKISENDLEKQMKVDDEQYRMLANDSILAEEGNEDGNSIKLLADASQLAEGSENAESEEITLNEFREKLEIIKHEENENTKHDQTARDKQWAETPLPKDCLIRSEEHQVGTDFDHSDGEITLKRKFHKDEKIKQVEREENVMATTIIDANSDNNERENELSKNEYWKQVPLDECKQDDCLLVDAIEGVQKSQIDDRIKQEKRKMQQETECDYPSNVDCEDCNGLVTDLRVQQAEENRDGKDHCLVELDKKNSNTDKNGEGGSDGSVSNDAIEFIQNVQEKERKFDYFSDDGIEANQYNSVSKDNTGDEKEKYGECNYQREVDINGSLLAEETNEVKSNNSSDMNSEISLKTRDEIADQKFESDHPNEVDCVVSAAVKDEIVQKDYYVGKYVMNIDNRVTNRSEASLEAAQGIQDKENTNDDYQKETDLKLGAEDKERCNPADFLIDLKKNLAAAPFDDVDEYNDCSKKRRYSDQQEMSSHESLIDTDQQKEVEASKHEEDVQMISDQSESDLSVDGGTQYSSHQCAGNRDWKETIALQEGLTNSDTDDVEDDVLYRLSNGIPVIYEEDENRGSQEFYEGKEDYNQESYEESLEELQQQNSVGRYEENEDIIFEDDENPADMLYSDEDEWDITDFSHEQQQSGGCTTVSCIYFKGPGMFNLTNYGESAHKRDINPYDFSDAEPNFRHSRKSLGARFTTAEDLSTYDISDDTEVNFSATESVQGDNDEFSTSRDHWLWRRPDWQKWLSASELEYVQPQDWYDGRSLSSDCLLLPNRYTTKANSVESITYVIVGADILWPIRRHHSVPANALMAQWSRQYAGDSQSNSQTQLYHTKRRKSLPGYKSTQINFKNNSSLKAISQIGAHEAAQKTADETSNTSANYINTTTTELAVRCDFAQQVSENQDQETMAENFNTLIPVKKLHDSDGTLDKEEAAHKDSVKQVSNSVAVSDIDAFINRQQGQPKDLLGNDPTVDRQIGLETFRMQDHHEKREIGKSVQDAEIYNDASAGNLMEGDHPKASSKLSAERNNHCTQATDTEQGFNWTPFSELSEYTSSRGNRASFRTAFSQTDITATSRNLLPYLSHPSLHGLHSNRTIQTQTHLNGQKDIETQTSPTFRNSQTQFNWSSCASEKSDLHQTEGKESRGPSPVYMGQNVSVNSELQEENDKSDDKKRLDKTASILFSSPEQFRNRAESIEMAGEDNAGNVPRHAPIVHRPLSRSSFEDTTVIEKSESNKVTNIPSHIDVEKTDYKRDLSDEDAQHDFGSRYSYLDLNLKNLDSQVPGVGRSSDNADEQHTNFTYTKLDFYQPLGDDAFNDKFQHGLYETLLSNGSDRKSTGDMIPNSENSFKNYNSACATSRYSETVRVVQRPGIVEPSHFQHDGSQQRSRYTSSWNAASRNNSVSSSNASSQHYKRYYSDEAGSERNAEYKIDYGNGLTSVTSARLYEARETREINQQSSKAEADKVTQSYNYNSPKVCLYSKVTSTTHGYYSPKSYNKWEHICSNSQQGSDVKVNQEHSKYFSDSQKKKYLTKADNSGSYSGRQIGSHLTWAEDSYLHSTKQSYHVKKDNNLAEMSGNNFGFLKRNYQTQSKSHVKCSKKPNSYHSNREETSGISTAIPITNSYTSAACSRSSSNRMQGSSLSSNKPCGSYSGSFKGSHHHIQAEGTRNKYDSAFKHHDKPQSQTVSSAVHEYDWDEIGRLRRERRRLLGLLVKDIMASKMRVEYAESQLNHQMNWTEQLLQEINKDDEADFLLYIR